MRTFELSCDAHALLEQISNKTGLDPGALLSASIGLMNFAVDAHLNGRDILLTNKLGIINECVQLDILCSVKRNI